MLDIERIRPEISNLCKNLKVELILEENNNEIFGYRRRGVCSFTHRG
jgi:hypothetical protein